MIPVLILAATLFAGCSPELTEPRYNDGDADFSKFIAIGGGLAAGYGDNALHKVNQQYSFPAIMGERFLKTSGTTYLQPLMNDGDGLGLLNNARHVYKLTNSDCGAPFIKALPISPTGDLTNTAWIGAAIQYQNLSVPGSRISDLDKQTFGDPNPLIGNKFYARFASNPGQSTVLNDAIIQNPTFYALLIGLEDIYAYAAGGGVQSKDSITSSSTFEAELITITGALNSVNAKGIIGTIPYPNTIPYFISIPWNGLELDATTAANYTQLYQSLNPAISFHEGFNAFVVSDTSAPAGRRQMIEGEMVLLRTSIDSIKCHGLGSLIGIPGKNYLSIQEVNEINNAIDGYNNIIRSTAMINNLAVAELDNLFNRLLSEYTFSGAVYSSSYIFNSAFSTDGFYPSPRGNALIANEFINTINQYYSARIPLADVNSYPTPFIP